MSVAAGLDAGAVAGLIHGLGRRNTRYGSGVTLLKVQLLSDAERARTAPDLLDPIDYRKSGLSLNHLIGCPLDCAYCVRHLFANFEMKQPRLLMSDEDAVDLLLEHRFFQAHLTPLQIFNRATDPFLPGVKDHTFNTLRLLASKGIRNHVLLITRFSVDESDAERLNQFRPLRLTLLVTYSGIDDKRIEPNGSERAALSLRTAFGAARSYRAVLYWRPIIAGLNDSPQHVQRAIELSRFAHATVFTGMFYRNTIQEHYRSNGLPQPYSETARRKIMPRDVERRIVSAFAENGAGPLFRKTSCGVAAAHEEPDYNGHYGVREICDICPPSQVARCKAAFKCPPVEAVSPLAESVGIDQDPDITSRALIFDRVDEQRRYFLQHSLGYQVHDRRHPHLHGQHGRAPIGWDDPGADDDNS